MSAKLIWITEEPEEKIAYCARVSNPSNQDNKNIERLLKYCFINGHFSIFEMVNMCIEIKTTTAIASQLVRHRSFCFQVFSQRYAKVEDKLIIPDLRRIDLKNRQNSIDDLDKDMVNNFQKEIEEHFNNTTKLYNKMLNSDIAKECCRFILPQATPCRLYMNGNIRSWIHYLKSRLDKSTQLEHRLVALEIKKIFAEQLPIINKILDNSLT